MKLPEGIKSIDDIKKLTQSGNKYIDVPLFSTPLLIIKFQKHEKYAQKFKDFDRVHRVPDSWKTSVNTSFPETLPDDPYIDIELSNSATGANFIKTNSPDNAIGFGNEYLEEYDQGTWTPSQSGVTFTVSNNNYIRIGNVVHIWCKIENMSESIGSAAVQLAGIPFATTTNQVIGNVRTNGIAFNSSRGGQTLGIKASADALTISVNISSGASVLMDYADISSTDDLEFFGTYIITT